MEKKISSVFVSCLTSFFRLDVDLFFVIGALMMSVAKKVVFFFTWLVDNGSKLPNKGRRDTMSTKEFVSA